jgi:exopolysaccharide production protein ExoZ
LNFTSRWVSAEDGQMQPMTKNVYSIQFMRFVAAAMVVFDHSTGALSSYFGDISETIKYVGRTGASGVHIFFVISGFVMVYSSFSRHGSEARFYTLDFLRRRFIRIYPIYWFYCICYLVFYEVFGQGYQLSLADILRSLLLLPDYSPLIIGPGWTLSYEIYFYLSFGVALAAGLFTGLIALAIYYAAFVVFGNIAHWHLQWPLLKFLSNPLLIEFLFGAGIAYLLLKRFSFSRNISIWLQLIAISLFAIAYVVGYGNAPTAITWGVPSALLIAGLVFNERKGIIWPFVKRLAFLGDSSYSLYLIHILIIDVNVRLISRLELQRIVGGLVLCFLITGACIICAIVCYEFVERKLLLSLRG